MPDGMPEPRHEFFTYLDTVVDFQKRAIASMDQVARRLDDQGAELRTITRTLATMREERIATDVKLNEISASIVGLDTRIGGLDTRIVGLDRQIVGLDKRIDSLEASIGARIDALAAEMRERFHAVGLRFEDLEKSIDQLSKDLHDARSDIILQNNQTLNAIQSAFISKRKVDEIEERLAALEAKLFGHGSS